MFTPRKLRRLVVSIIFFAGFSRLRAEEAALSVALAPNGGPAMKGVAYKFFDDKTGACTGRMQVGRVLMEYRQQGFLRVAWKPLVVLAGVEFDFGNDMEWTAQGGQVGHDLLALGGRDELVLRDVRVHLGGSPRREIVAPTARLLSGGALEFLDATLAVDAGAPRPAGTLRLMLNGPTAGRLVNGATLASATGGEKISQNNSHHQLNP